MMVHAEHKDTADYNYVTTCISTGINLLYDSVMVDLGQHTTCIKFGCILLTPPLFW